MVDYMHGADAAEQERLGRQARMFGGTSFLPPLEPRMRLLEIGCGPGFIACDVGRRVAEVVGIDRQPAQIAAATERARDLGIGNVTFLVGDATSSLPAPGAFDGAYCRFVLEHLEKPAAMLAAMAAAVRPGGFVCAYEWENACFTSHPDCPDAEAVWDSICVLQDRSGGNGHMGRALLGAFRDAGLGSPAVRAHAWLMRAGSDELRWYVDGARLIIEQTKERLLRDGLATSSQIEGALAEYARLLRHPTACAIEVMVSATAWRGAQ